MKVFLKNFLVMLCIAAMLLQTVAAKEHNGSFYSDVPETSWSYSAIRLLYDHDILTPTSAFQPQQYETRGNFVQNLYRLALALGQPSVAGGTVPFVDVPSDDPAYVWAFKNEIICGVSETAFAPDLTISRQDVCVILIRFAHCLGIAMGKTAQFSPFKDSFRIDQYAKTPVAVCQMTGLVNGYENGFFVPGGQITREECAAIICRLYQSAKTPLPSGVECVLTGEGVYDSLYAAVYTGFDTTLTLGEEVGTEYFDDAVFVGDSVSVMLQYYCAATKALGNAKFLCAGSLSATNALGAVTQTSVHPSYQGKKVKVADGVAATDAKKVYIMLGINNISFGLDKATGDMITLINGIKEKSPDVAIYIQSVTPMSKESTILSQGLNNEKILQYNARMEELCAQNGWFFVNVAEAFRDENGFLPAEYCSDYSGMGIHFTNAAAQHWIAYLKTHTTQ